MPTIRNKTGQDLSLHRVGLEIEAHGTLEVTDDQAAALAGHPQLETLDVTSEPTTGDEE